MKTIGRFLFVILLLIILVPFTLAESTITEKEPGPQGGFQGNETTQNPQKIAFVSKRNKNADIYVINEDGSGLLQLTSGKEDDIMPQWSPNGKKILYVALKKGKWEIWTVNSDGSNQLQLAKDCETNYPPAWSPDSSKILFVKKHKLFVINADRSNLTALTPDNSSVSDPSWSPDSTKVLCVLCMYKLQNETHIYSLNSDGSNQVKLTGVSGSYGHPTWSPDGKKIVYINQGGFFLLPRIKLYKMDPDGNNSREIVDGVDFRWAPDSNLIIFKKIINREPIDENNVIDTYGILITKVDSGGFNTDLKISGKDDIAFPEWIPDASKVAYINQNHLVVYTLINDETSAIKVPIAIGTPKWSNDGRKIVCSGKTDLFKKTSLFLVSADNGSVVRLTNETADDSPVWQPNGK